MFARYPDENSTASSAPSKRRELALEVAVQRTTVPETSRDAPVPVPHRRAAAAAAARTRVSSARPR